MFKCKKCGHTEYALREKGTATGLYCAKCGFWHKWVGKSDLQRYKGGLYKSKMKVITLCGSTRFKDDFEQINKELTLQGNIVISVAFFCHSGDVITENQKILLDKIHKSKIDIADTVYIINKNGYIGNSTKSEIEYAKSKGKEIIYMEAL